MINLIFSQCLNIKLPKSITKGWFCAFIFSLQRSNLSALIVTFQSIDEKALPAPPCIYPEYCTIR